MNKEDRKYEVLPAYPHFNAADAHIWTRFIASYPDLFDSVDYDVTCGEGPGVQDDLKPEYQRNADYLGSYKIDVVGRRKNVHYIIEVKPYAGPHALGQILSYAILYDAYDSSEEQVVPMIVTDRTRADMEKLCAHYGVKYFVV